MSIFGVDISFYQDDDGTPQGFNFEKLKAEGGKFVIIRAGQGLGVDPDFRRNMREAKKVGLPRGTYWYLDGKYSLRQQARIYGGLLSEDAGEITPSVDFEQIAEKGKKQLYSSDLDAFMIYTNEYYPMKEEMMIYTGPSFWKTYGSRNSKYAKHPLWIAHYGVSTPDVPAPWKDYKFWQATDDGPGLKLGAESLGIDVNYLNGELPNAPIPEPTPDPIYGIYQRVDIEVLSKDPSTQVIVKIPQN